MNRTRPKKHLYLSAPSGQADNWDIKQGEMMRFSQEIFTDPGSFNPQPEINPNPIPIKLTIINLTLNYFKLLTTTLVTQDLYHNHNTILVV